MGISRGGFSAGGAVVVRRALLVLFAACGADTAARPLEGETAEAARRYPDLFTIYAGDQGIYRGCGPSGGVCHNGNEFPNLASLGSVVDNIDRDCNLKRTDPLAIHDLCERRGDVLSSDAGESEIAWIEVAGSRTWRVRLREPIALGGAVEIRRGDRTVISLADIGGSAAVDPAEPVAVILAVPAPTVTDPEDPPEDPGLLLDRAGAPGDPLAVRVGDPNRNGVFGDELGGRIIRPGDPTRSYLLARLLDPDAGPLMPRANCCQWSKPAVRALYCWIEGLAGDGHNALSPIDYQKCSAGPSVELLYPEPGPACEAQGLCPAEAATAGDEPTFHNVYARVLVPACSGSGCHGSEPVGGLDFAGEQRAYDSLAHVVAPGDPARSRLLERLDPARCVAPDCATMPLGRPPLAADKLELVTAWIEQGALR